MITETIQVAGSRNPRWQIVSLTEETRPLIEATLVSLDKIMIPATEDEISEIMIGLANHYRKDRTETEWRLLTRDYIDDLCEFPAAMIRKAVRLHRQTKNWFPKIAELREMLVPMAIRGREYRRRARVLLGLERPHFLDVPIDTDTGPPRDMTPVLVALNGMRVA